MTLDEIVDDLRTLGSEKIRELNAKNGAGDNQFGVKLGDLRTLAKKVKADHELATALWRSGNVDAMLLATLVLKPKQIATDELDSMVSSATYTQLADWLVSYVVKVHPQKELLRQTWMESNDIMTARAG